MPYYCFSIKKQTANVITFSIFAAIMAEASYRKFSSTVSFEDEYRQFLIDNGIEIDERYFLKD